MTTECKQVGFEFHPLKQRQIRVQFDGGAITSDGGGRLLREVEKRTGVLRQFAACFSDYRDPERIEHTVQELVAQRVYGLALGSKTSMITISYAGTRYWRYWWRSRNRA